MTRSEPFDIAAWANRQIAEFVQQKPNRSDAAQARGGVRRRPHSRGRDLGDTVWLRALPTRSFGGRSSAASVPSRMATMR